MIIKEMEVCPFSIPKSHLDWDQGSCWWTGCFNFRRVLLVRWNHHDLFSFSPFFASFWLVSWWSLSPVLFLAFVLDYHSHSSSLNFSLSFRWFDQDFCWISSTSSCGASCIGPLFWGHSFGWTFFWRLLSLSERSHTPSHSSFLQGTKNRDNFSKASICRRTEVWLMLGVYCWPKFISYELPHEGSVGS